MNDNYQEICQTIRGQAYSRWSRVLNDLDTDADTVHTVMHLPFSSSWIFTTGKSCRWCLDPAPRHILSEQEYQTVADTLGRFDFCIISHLHDDHYDVQLLQLMQNAGNVTFIIPDCIAGQFLSHSGLDASRCRVIPFGQRHGQCGIQLTVLPGLHGEKGAAGLPSASFLVELPDGRRLGFPIDVRDYSQPLPPQLQEVDYLFAHVWLGRRVSHLECPPLLEDFCQFCLALRPRNVLLGHLYEIGREEDSMWTSRHSSMVEQRLRALAPTLPVYTPPLGDSMLLL